MTKRKKKQPKRRSSIAKSLAEPKYQQKIVPNKKRQKIEEIGRRLDRIEYYLGIDRE